MSDQENAVRRRRLLAAAILVAGGAGLAVTLLGGAIFGMRINLSASEPLGIWRIRPLAGMPKPGDLVFVCPPAAEPFVEARRRGYLRRGTCPSGYAPLIKSVIAGGGQRVSVGDAVHVDDAEIGNSRLLRTDGAGRELRPHTGGLVPPGSVFLHSPYAGSWDSRYFGAVDAAAIIGRAELVYPYAR